jgi:hypothetical protein
MPRNPTAARIAYAAALLVLALTLVPAALAGKGGGTTGGGGHKSGGGGSTGGTSYTGSFVGANPVMVTDTSGNGSPNAGDTVTFDVTSTAPSPFVRLDCYQNGTLVMSETQGFFVSWLWGQNYYLGGYVWTSGAANCTATLYSQSSTGTVEPTEATLSFQVGA